MFFTYSNGLGKLEAGAAKLDRIQLIETLINQYEALEILDKKEKNIDIVNFLHLFRTELYEVNDCKNRTERMSEILKDMSQAPITHPEYEKIKSILNKCLEAIDLENGFAQARARNLARNNLAQIKNRSIYTGSLPIAAIVSGAILAVFNLPVGLIVLGIAVIAGILSQAIYWLSCQKEYAQLYTNIKQNVLASDYVYASGKAIPSEKLPLAPDHVLRNNNDLEQEDARPVLFGEKADKMVDELVESVPELVSDVAAVVYGGFSSLYLLVAGASSAEIQATNRHLHSL